MSSARWMRFRVAVEVATDFLSRGGRIGWGARGERITTDAADNRGIIALIPVPASRRPRRGEPERRYPAPMSSLSTASALVKAGVNARLSRILTTGRERAADLGDAGGEPVIFHHPAANFRLLQPTLHHVQKNFQSKCST